MKPSDHNHKKSVLLAMNTLELVSLVQDTQTELRGALLRDRRREAIPDITSVEDMMLFIYNSEINLEFHSFWDRGYEFKLHIPRQRDDEVFDTYDFYQGVAWAYKKVMDFESGKS